MHSDQRCLSTTMWGDYREQETNAIKSLNLLDAELWQCRKQAVEIKLAAEMQGREMTFGEREHYAGLCDHEIYVSLIPAVSSFQVLEDMLGRWSERPQWRSTYYELDGLQEVIERRKKDQPRIEYSSG